MRAIRNSNIWEKYYVFSNHEVTRYCKLKESVGKKIRGWLTNFFKKRLSMDIKRVLMNLLKKYLKIQSINRKKTVTVNMENKQNSKHKVSHIWDKTLIISTSYSKCGSNNNEIFNKKVYLILGN